MNNEYSMGYYIPVAPEKVAEWNDYRNKVFAYRDAMRALGDEIGAANVWTGFGGAIVGAVFKFGEDGKEIIHASFSNQTKKNGCHPILSRGRSESQKQAIKEFDVKNKALAAMKPHPEKIAEAHGFIFGIRYTTETGHGSASIGSPFQPVQAAWYDPNGPVLVFAPDVQVSIDKFRASHEASVKQYPEYERPLTSIEPEVWATPEGYERISESKWNLMKSTFEVAKEEAGDHED